MNQPNQDYQSKPIPSQMPERNVQLRAKQSNYSVSSEVSFNGESKKPKSKSFNRKKGNSQYQMPPIVKIYRQLQYPVQIRNVLRKYCYLDKDKLLKLSFNQLRQLCEKELKRIELLRKNNGEVRRALLEEEIQETDNELSLVVMNWQIGTIIQYKNQLNVSESAGSQSMTRTRLRQYENILLEIEKSDQIIKNFINTHIKLPQPSEISIPTLKKFFKKQAYMMSQSSDRIILSRKTLCQIIIFLCRLLEGQILAFDDIYEYQDESYNSIEFGDEYSKYVVKSKTVRNNQVIVQNLDQSFEESQHSSNNYSQKQNGNNNSKNGNFKSYSNDDLGKKVKELAGICQQIPQLQAFTRTLKFSKISLSDRESFFKIVDVIIALHHKIGYLSRNKPTLLREIQSIENDITEVYETIREYVIKLTSDVPQFGELRFSPNQDSKHQLTETIAYLRKQLKKLGNIILEQNNTEKELYERIEFYRTVIQIFCQAIGDDQTLWKDYVQKSITKTSGDEQKETINSLTECYNAIFSELRQNPRPAEDLQTEKNLQAEVHTLLTDYERLRGEHQELQGKYNVLLEQKDELMYDVEERDKIISNLTAIKISSQKREKSLRDQLIQAQQDASRFEHDLSLLEEQLQIMSIQNQNKLNDMIYEHQTEVKELVDKITMLQRAKMELLSKYEDECSKSIRLLQDGNYSSVEMQTLKDRLDKKAKEHDQLNRKQKEMINALEKQLQELKNQKSLLQNKLQLAEKNKTKLMNRLQEMNNKYNSNVRDFQDKYQEELISLKEASYKMQKQLQKYKRNNGLLADEIQQLKAENAALLKTINEQRMKLLQLNGLQGEYDSLTKEYDRVVESFHKLETTNQTYKQKIFEMNTKIQELLELLAKQKEINRKLDKKCKDQDSKLQDIINSYQGNDMDLKQQQKINKMLQKKISQLQTQLQQLQDSISQKDKTYTLNINKTEQKYQQINGQLQQEIDRLKKKNRQLEGDNDKKAKELKTLERQLKEQITEEEQKEMQWNKLKGQLEKKLNDKEGERLGLEDKNRLLDQQCFNYTIIIQEIKQEKQILQLKLNELQNEDKFEIAELRNKIQLLQNSEKGLKDKVIKLTAEGQRLNEEIQQLKAMIREKDRELEASHEQTRKRLKQKQQQQNQKKFQQYHQKTQQITQIREQILIQKNVIITENNKLHEENNNLQEEIAKLKQLNDSLQKNIKKLQTNSSQARQQFSHQQNNFKQTISKHLFTITSLENELTGVNAEREMLRRDYEELVQKLQLKTKQLTEKDNLLFERELEKNNLDKLVKELKFKITQLQGIIEGLNSTVDKLKTGRIKLLQQQINQLNLLLQEWKKKEQLARSSLNDLQQQLQKSKRDTTKKLQSLKHQNLQLQEQYQTQLRKLQSQHQIQLSSLQQKTRKDAQNQFNQALIKEKDMFNLLTIQKMEELGEMQRKYEKLIRDERNERNLLQEQYDRLEREFAEWKRNKAISDSKLLQEDTGNNEVVEELQKLKSDYEVLKRDYNRLQQQNNRLNTQTVNHRQQNSTLLSKLLQAQHTIAILTSKLNLLTQNLQTTMKTLQDMHKIHLEKMDLQREVQKLRIKANNDDVRINDYKARLAQLEERVNDLEGKLQVWRSKELEWTRDNNQTAERFRLLNNQSNDMSLKLQQMKQKLNQMTKKLTEKTQIVQTVQTQLQLTQQKLKQKEIQFQSMRQHLEQEINILQEQVNKKSAANMMLEREKKELINEWEIRQNELRQDGDLKLRKVRELEIQLNEYRKNLSEGNRMIEELSQAKGQKMELQDRLKRLQSELVRIKGEKLGVERENQLLRKELNSLGSEKSKSTTQLIDLQHQNTILSTENAQLSHKIQQLLEQLKKQKQFSLKQLKKLQDRLRSEFDSQKQAIINDFDHMMREISEELKRQQVKNNQWSIKYNRLLQEIEQNAKMLQKLRRENMQLSDHCQKYEERIHVLENQYKVKGQFSVEIESKYNSTQFEMTRLQDSKIFLEGELEKLRNQNLSQKQRIQQLERDLGNYQIDQKESQKRISQLETDRQQLLKLIHQLEEERDKFKNDAKNLQLKYNESLGDLQRMKNENASLQQTVSQLSTKIEQHQKLINSYQSNVTSSNSELEKFRTESLRLQQLLNQANNQAQSLKRKLADANSKITQTERENQAIKGENHSLLETIKERERELELLGNQIGVLQQNLHEAEGYIQWSDNERKAMDERIKQLLNEMERLNQEIKNLQGKLFQLEGEKNKKDYESKHLSTENQSLQRRVSELQNYLKQLQNQQKLSLQQKSTQQSAQIQRLKAELALARQQILRLNDVIKRKEEDFEKEITRLTEQKGAMWKDNQMMAKEIQSLTFRLSEGERLLEVKGKELEGEKKEKERLTNEIEVLRRELANLKRQLAQSSQALSDLQRKQQQLLRNLAQSQRKQQQLTRALINQQSQVRRLSNQNQTHKSRLSAYSLQQDEQLKLSESRLREQTESLGSEIARLQSQLAVTRMEYSRLNQEHGKLVGDFNRVNGDHGKLVIDFNRLNDEHDKLLGDFNRLHSEHAKLVNEFGRLNGDHDKLLGDFNRLNSEHGKLVNQFNRLNGEHSKLSGELSRVNGENGRLVGDFNRVNGDLNNFVSENTKLKEEVNRLRAQIQHWKKQLSSRDQSLLHLTRQLQTITNQSSTKHAISSSIKQDLDKANLQLNNIKAVISRLEQENQNLKSILASKDKIIAEMKDNVNKGNELMENADRELKKAFEERNRQGEIIKGLMNEKDGYLQVIKSRETEIINLKETITIMERRINQLTREIHHLTQTNQQTLKQSRSAINLVTKSYSYQGGQVTAAQLARLQEQNRRLIKQIESRDLTIERHSLEIQRLNKQIKVLKEQIRLLSQGKTINLKGYTRVTNNNDTTLNTKGIVYTEYDVKEMRAKIQLLERSLSMYQDRESELLREMEKYKFRQRHLLEQVRVLEETLKANNKMKKPDSVKEVQQNIPQKKTSFDDQYNNRSNQPRSSTYRIQTGIEVTQHTINMTKKQIKTTEKHFLRMQGEQLRRILERLSSGQQIMSSKIDEILNSSQKSNKESLELVLANNQFNLTPVIINEIRQLIHQNKALVQTLRLMGQFREDVGVLVQEYIDPQLLTEFVYRILTYFSQVADQSPEAKEIRNELNLIRKNNVGGFYFTVLEEYTKYILENNSIEIYKEELRQKARELISFREKFQAIIDSKLDQNDKLLNKSDSKNSFLNRSRTKYMGSERLGSSRGKSQCSELSRDGSNSRVIAIDHRDSGSSTGRVSMPTGTNVLPNPINLLTNAGQNNYISNNMLSPMLVTAERVRTTSTITYTPYNKQTINVTTTPVQSANDSRVHASYSMSATNMVSSYTTVNSSTGNFIKPGFDKK